MILIYDGSYEGFLSAVFDAYALRVADGALIRPEAVSYTHLDVYKRQVFPSVIKAPAFSKDGFSELSR